MSSKGTALVRMSFAAMVNFSSAFFCLSYGAGVDFG